MVELMIDEEVFAKKFGQLPRTIRVALWDYVGRALENPDNPDLGPWEERKGYRASQFTSGWILDWEVIRQEKSTTVDLSYGAPQYVKLWDIRVAPA